MSKLQDIAPPLHIMVVEDDFLQASHLIHAIRASGDEVVGPFLDAHEAIHHAGAAQAAILDVRIDGKTSFDIANSLKHKSIPFLFLTGYDKTEIPLQFDRRHIYQKPTKTSIILQDLHRQYSKAETSSTPTTEDMLRDILLVAQAMMPDNASAERIMESILHRAITDANNDLVFDMRKHLLDLLTEEFYLRAHRYLH